MDWTDKRPIEELRFGSEWKPKLTEYMEQHPWSDSAYTFTPPEGMKPEDVTEEFKAAQLAMWKRRMAGIPTEEALKAWADEHAMRIRAVREILKACGCTIAEDIKKLGCTGIAAHFPGETVVEIAKKIGVELFGSSSVRRPFPADDDLTKQMNAVTSASPVIDVIRFLRIGLAGSGVGLPCFVPPNRYCHGHEVIGGLQDKQEAHHLEQISSISRELQPEEKAHNELIREAQHASEERGAAELLRGRRMPEGWMQESVDGGEAVSPVSPMTTAALSGMPDVVGAARARLPERKVESHSPVSFHCPEHDEPSWKCRYCVAQMIVEGELEPVFAVRPDIGGFTKASVSAGEAQSEIGYLDSAGANRVDLYVLAATFTRKLAR